jgi:hypothetical protein
LEVGIRFEDPLASSCGDRATQGMLIALRSVHGNVQEYLKKFRIPREVRCKCRGKKVRERFHFMECNLPSQVYDLNHPTLNLVRGKRTKRKTQQQEAYWLLGRGIRKLGKWLKNTNYVHEYTSSKVPVDAEGKAEHFPWDSLTLETEWNRKVRRARSIRRVRPQNYFWGGRDMQYTDLMARILDLPEGRDRTDLIAQHSGESRMEERTGAIEGSASGD